MSAFQTGLSFLKQRKRCGNASNFPWVYERSKNDLSYRLPDAAKFDHWIGFKELYRIIKRKKFKQSQLQSGHLMLVSTSNQIQIAREYVLANLKSAEALHVISREELKISTSFRFLLFSLLVSIQCIWSRNRLNLALQIREVMEWACVLKLMHENHLKSFIDFTPFEKDANLLSLLLMEQGIDVMKIPSPGPLSAHHTHLIANSVVCSSAYHLEEIAQFTNWTYNSLLHWPPEQYHTYEHLYQMNQQTPVNSIAFYSHGEWVRREEGHADPGLGILENEAIILSELRTFLQENNHITLVIYPHPKERKRKDMLAHYTQLLSDCSFHIFDGETPTAWNFHEEDIAIMAYSTLLFERLSLGFKTLFVSAQAGPFPLSTSPLNNICIRSEVEFQKKLKNALQESQIEFFENNQLQTYRLSHFLEAKNGQD